MADIGTLIMAGIQEGAMPERCRIYTPPDAASVPRKPSGAVGRVYLSDWTASATFKCRVVASRRVSAEREGAARIVSNVDFKIVIERAAPRPALNSRIRVTMSADGRVRDFDVQSVRAGSFESAHHVEVVEVNS